MIPWLYHQLLPIRCVNVDTISQEIRILAIKNTYNGNIEKQITGIQFSEIQIQITGK